MTGSTVSYRVRLDPAGHEIGVAMTIRGPAAGGTVRLETPTWVPGDYEFVAYGRDVFDVAAVDAQTGAQLTVDRDGWQAYAVHGAHGVIEVSYRACCSSWDFSEACGILGDSNGVLLGTRYLHVPAHAGTCRVTYELPEGWDVHHPSGPRHVAGRTWEYDCYDVLLDTPVALGVFDLLTRDVDGTPFHFVFLDRGVGFQSRVEAFVDRVVAVAAGYRELFGRFPFEDYTFVLSLNPNAGWGLEHLTSTMVGLGPTAFTDPDAFATGVRACAHELFHAWNVRRLRPAPLDRLDLYRGSFTEGLWVAEGFTRYYEFLACTRAGVYTPQQFFSSVVNYYRHLAALPAYERVSPVDASLATYLNHDDKYPGRVNNAIDYYDAGMIIAFWLDATLRGDVPGVSLDTAFRGFYDEYVGRGDGYGSADIRRFLNGLRPALGDDVVRQASEPGMLRPIEALRRIGFDVEDEAVPYIGLVLLDGVGPAIYGVLDTSPGGASGIASEDVITAVDGAPFDLGVLRWTIAHEPAVVLDVLRGNASHRYTIAVGRRTQVGRLIWTGGDEQATGVGGWLGQEFHPSRHEELPLDFYENFHGVETVI